MNIYPFSTYSYSVYNVCMDHVDSLYHQRNGFYLEKQIEQLPLSGQVHLPNADRNHICKWVTSKGDNSSKGLLPRNRTLLSNLDVQKRLYTLDLARNPDRLFQNCSKLHRKEVLEN